MDTNTYDIIIIGGGASGLMLAAQLDLKGRRGLILEGTSRAGSKLLMSGGGHCNITHGGSVKDFLKAYGDAGPALRRCLYRHSNLELARWLVSRGLELADENGNAIDVYSYGNSALEGIGRIFPASMRAADVRSLFMREAEKNGWVFEYGAKVTGLRRRTADAKALSPVRAADGDEEPYTWIIELTGGRELRTRNAVIATGGITYPETGSDGSAFPLLRKLGISVTTPRPALSTVYVKDYPYAELSGVSIPDVSVTTFSDDAACTCKGISARMRGDLLFTHRGLSGPVILNISKYAQAGQIIRLSYNKTLSELPRRMQRILEERAKGPSGDVRTTVLAGLLDHDDLIVAGIDERGMVTSGGISLECIEHKTMRIKEDRPHDAGDPDISDHIISDDGSSFCGLYAIGEAIDADGITGGYNLQLCWSTAAAAAGALSGDR